MDHLILRGDGQFSPSNFFFAQTNKQDIFLLKVQWPVQYIFSQYRNFLLRAFFAGFLFFYIVRCSIFSFLPGQECRIFFSKSSNPHPLPLKIKQPPPPLTFFLNSKASSISFNLMYKFKYLPFKTDTLYRLYAKHLWNYTVTITQKLTSFPGLFPHPYSREKPWERGCTKTTE